ncbi:LppX_LprAFG lipoprotein [Longimycelium tulufanense]|nr:LppX_LprAFG lipoprotein [Longimycelium tulufanense]
MILRCARLGALVLLATLVAGCTDDAKPAQSLPDGGELLRQSAAAMRSVESVHFTINADGAVAGLPLRGAEGDLTRAGNARGKARVQQAGSVAELDFVLVDQDIYVKGPTGGYQRFPAGLAATLYDPSAILDPERGVAKLLSEASGPRTEAEEEVAGTKSYRVAATAPKDALSGLLPGMTEDVPGTLWVDAGSKRLVQARFDVPGADGGNKVPVTVAFSDFGKQVDIRPPA